MVRMLTWRLPAFRLPCFYLFFLLLPSFFVARVSEAIPGDGSEACNIVPGYRFAHPGYENAPSVIEPKPVLPPGLFKTSA
jgi:hypothetical protein